jgi:peptidoglycan/LPS O-acetylase OafA/YrhL
VQSNIQLLRFLAALMVVSYHVSGLVLASQQSLSVVFEAARSAGFAGKDIYSKRL